MFSRCFFFFSSRRRHTRLQGDWSSDVCSSDLNEGFEVSTVEGKRTYDVLLELLDPKLVKFQFQMSTIRNGFDAAEYFMKYPGRFYSMHLQDWNSETRTAAAVGKGGIDWKKTFNAAKTGG